MDIRNVLSNSAIRLLIHDHTDLQTLEQTLAGLDNTVFLVTHPRNYICYMPIQKADSYSFELPMLMYIFHYAIVLKHKGKIIVTEKYENRYDMCFGILVAVANIAQDYEYISEIKVLNDFVIVKSDKLDAYKVESKSIRYQDHVEVSVKFAKADNVIYNGEIYAQIGDKEYVSYANAMVEVNKPMRAKEIGLDYYTSFLCVQDNSDIDQLELDTVYVSPEEYSHTTKTVNSFVSVITRAMQDNKRELIYGNLVTYKKHIQDRTFTVLVGSVRANPHPRNATVNDIVLHEREYEKSTRELVYFVIYKNHTLLMRSNRRHNSLICAAMYLAVQQIFSSNAQIRVTVFNLAGEQIKGTVSDIEQVMIVFDNIQRKQVAVVSVMYLSVAPVKTFSYVLSIYREDEPIIFATHKNCIACSDDIRINDLLTAKDLQVAS